MTSQYERVYPIFRLSSIDGNKIDHNLDILSTLLTTHPPHFLHYRRCDLLLLTLSFCLSLLYLLRWTINAHRNCPPNNTSTTFITNLTPSNLTPSLNPPSICVYLCELISPSSIPSHSPPMWNSEDSLFDRTASFRGDAGEGGKDQEEDSLRWAALERLPTFSRVRRGIFRDLGGGSKEVGLSDLQEVEQRMLLDRLVHAVDHDPERFFERMRHRFHA